MLAIENSQRDIETPTQRANRQLAALNEASQRILAIRNEDELGALVPRLLCETLDFHIAILNVNEGNKLFMRGVYVNESDPSATARFIHSARTEDHVPPPDIRRCFDLGVTIISDSDGWNDPFGWPKAIILTPIRLDGAPVGVLVVSLARGARDLDDLDVQRFEAFANMVSLALGNIRALASLEKRVDERTHALRCAQAQLVQSEKMASLGALVAGVCHELNTPIGTLGSAQQTLANATSRLLELLPEDMAEDCKIDRYRRAIVETNGAIGTASKRVGTIVRRLRSFACLDEAELQSIELHDAIDDTLALLSHRVDAGVKITRAYGDLPLMSCNASRIKQMLMNLLTNALQAVDGEGTVGVRTHFDGVQASITIEDNGVGIEEGELIRIFDPGYTTKGVGVGTGLGLSICFEVAREHGGTIEVDSKVGQGARFTVKLPVEPQH